MHPLALELSLELCLGRHEQKPEVDLVILGFTDDPLYLIPIEAKKHCEVGHMSQLAHYVSTLCLHSHASVGLLMDSEQVMLTFSYLSNRPTNSPPISWHSAENWVYATHVDGGGPLPDPFLPHSKEEKRGKQLLGQHGHKYCQQHREMKTLLRRDIETEIYFQLCKVMLT